ncbi:MAG: TRAP transporter large permease [Candidatus Cloacimonetes bacterium]|nr:TRAP transporter large permease [Candidatus Cloacimonadota bacterium]MDD4024261.1 TRAP transporter large permease [Synergistales bacterium]MDD5515511.1 TRAP transporter large permease [Synergistales bacterium]
MIWPIMIGLLLLFLLASLPVAGTMANLAFLLNNLFSPLPLWRASGEISWAVATDFNLFAIPLFILLGQLLVISGIARTTYKAVDNWLSWLPGGLMHANIATSALFAATSGSSVATAATMGTIALPEARRFGYNEGLFSASIAAGGTLGILIPPSINMIVYGFLTNTSIPKLFIAGIFPGIILALMFMGYVLLACTVRPELGSSKRDIPWKEKITSLKDLLPMLLIFGVVMGSIYAGFATPTESAALGVLVALGLTAWKKQMSWKNLLEATEGTLRTTGMIMLILFAAYFLNFIFIALGLTDQIVGFISATGLTPVQTFLLIVLIYIVLGFFVETLSMMVLTIPVIHPIVVQLGFDSVWFGIILIILVEIALITPPVGLNLYVVQGIRQRGSIKDMLIWIAPFVLAGVILILLLMKFPMIALYLPGKF